MAPGKKALAKRQVLTACRIALWAPPQSATAHGASSVSSTSISPASPVSAASPASAAPPASAASPSSVTYPAPSPSPPLPPQVLPQPPSAPPPLTQPSANSPASPTVADASQAASTVAEASQVVMRSIRCKSLYVRGGKNKRGVVVGSKTDNIVRVTGKKIVIKYSTFHNGPADRDSCSLLSRDIGSCVRACVPMLQPTFMELDPNQQFVVSIYLSTNYEIAHDDDKMWDWVCDHAENCYRQWKSKCLAHWRKYGDDLPLEFQNRPEQWNWLVTHFKDEKFQTICKRNQGNRLMNPDQLNHHSGALALSYRASEHAEKGNPAPFVAAFLDAYELDPKAKVVLDKVKRKLGEMLDLQSDGSAESLLVDDQVQVIEEGMGRKKGTSIRGVGAAIRRDAKTRGATQLNSSVTQAEERIRKALEEAQLAKKEALLAKEKAERATEEALRAKQEFQLATEQSKGVMDRLQALEEALAAKQGAT